MKIELNNDQHIVLTHAGNQTVAYLSDSSDGEIISAAYVDEGMVFEFLREKFDWSEDNVGKIKEQLEEPMTFGDFCKKALSNDLIGLVDDVMQGEPEEIKPAYKFLVEGGELLDRNVDRFTYGKCKDEKILRDVLFVKLTDPDSEKLVKELTYIGMDSWSRPVYRDEDGKLWKDTDPRKGFSGNICSALNNAFDGEPDCPISSKYELKFIPARMFW